MCILCLGETAAPRAILTGHETVVTMICVSAEHGVVVSASKGIRRQFCYFDKRSYFFLEGRGHLLGIPCQGVEFPWPIKAVVNVFEMYSDLF